MCLKYPASAYRDYPYNKLHEQQPRPDNRAVDTVGRKAHPEARIFQIPAAAVNEIVLHSTSAPRFPSPLRSLSRSEPLTSELYFQS